MKRIFETINFWIRGKTIYDIHSPFLFELLHSFVDNSQNFYVFNQLKNNYYSKSAKIKLFKIIRYWNPIKLYLLHPIHAGSLQFLSTLSRNLSIVEINGSYNNFSPRSCFVIDGQNKKSLILDSLQRLAPAIHDENQLVVILHPPTSLSFSPEEIDQTYNLLVHTQDILLLFSQPGYGGERNHFIVSRFMKPWRLGFFN